jgi:copper chaperone
VIRFKVSGMTCAHCVRAVSAAVKSVDPGAEVDVDLAGGEVTVRSPGDPAKIAAAIKAAGYAARQTGG